MEYAGWVKISLAGFSEQGTNFLFVCASERNMQTFFLFV